MTVDAVQERASDDKLYVYNNDGSNAALCVLVLAKPCCLAAASSAETASLVRLLSGTVAAADGSRTMHTVTAVEVYSMTCAGFAQATRAVAAGGLALVRLPSAKTASLCPTRSKKKKRRRRRRSRRQRRRAMARAATGRGRWGRHRWLPLRLCCFWVGVHAASVALPLVARRPHKGAGRPCHAALARR